VKNLKTAMDLASGAGRPLSQADLLQLASCTDCTQVFHTTLLNLMGREDVQVSYIFTQSKRNIVNADLNAVNRCPDNHVRIICSSFSLKLYIYMI
jgi:hypothetical protein